MSTRATYQIGKICFYIHHDGYLEGAAYYFHNMFACKNPRSGLAGRFFRGNENAEFTDSHRAHGDTEYRYTLDEKTMNLKVEAINYDHNKWNVAFDGSVVDFVNKYMNDSSDPIVPVATKYGHTRWMPLKQALKHVDHLRLSAINSAVMRGWSANLDSEFDDFIAGAESVVKGAFDAGGDAIRLVELVGGQAHTMKDMLAEAKMYRDDYYKTGIEALTALAEERGIVTEPVLFGDPRCNLWSALTKWDYANDIFKFYESREVMAGPDGYKRKHVIPADVDALEWLNFDRDGYGCHYTADQIEEVEK